MPDNWIQSYTGRKIVVLDVKPSDICLRDIAHHLACVNRWTGAARRPISVAEHSVIVSERAEQLAREFCQQPRDKFNSCTDDITKRFVQMVARWGLLHDASEAYIADVASPLKHAPEMAGYRAAEKRIMHAVCEWAQIPQKQPVEVGQADAESLSAEAFLLMMPLRPGWNLKNAPHLPLEPAGIGWRHAEELFLKRAFEVGLKDEYI